MGLLDSMFGGGQQGPAQPGVPEDTFRDRFRAQYAPGAYAAHQGNLQQQAVYSAAMQTPGMSPQIAQALAMSPQFFQAQQGAYLPQATNAQVLQNSDGGQTLVDVRNRGGVPGHGHELSGLPITAPGTTANPVQAAGGQRGTAPQEPTGNEPAAVSGPTDTLQGMPGGTNAIIAQIDANKAAGKDPMLGVPKNYILMANAVREGREKLSDITSQRGAQTKNIINSIIQAAEPDFDENMNVARNEYRKEFVSGKAGSTGGQVKSLNTLAAHANGIADAITAMPNIGLGGSALAHYPNKYINQIYSTPAAGLNSASDKYANELSTFLSGKAQSGVEERKDRKGMYSSEKTPQEMGQALLTDIDFLEKRAAANEQQRNSVFKDPKMQEQFPLISPEARQYLAEAKAKAHKLLGDQPAGGGGLPPGVTVKKLP